MHLRVGLENKAIQIINLDAEGYFMLKTIFTVRDAEYFTFEQVRQS